MIAFDLFEKMDPEPFDLIGADAGQSRFSDKRQIKPKRAFIKRAHRQAGDFGRFVERGAVPRKAESGGKLMSSPGKQTQAAFGAGHVLRLMQDAVA